MFTNVSSIEDTQQLWKAWKVFVEAFTDDFADLNLPKKSNLSEGNVGGFVL